VRLEVLVMLEHLAILEIQVQQEQAEHWELRDHLEVMVQLVLMVLAEH
jgi:hypothetical protein